MLLPSDVARVVLGYLQWEGLSSTSQTFINESPHLKEYAEHSTEDAVIPACVFSLCGKNLTTILNEYAAAKAKETSHEVPVMMTSLWKKLDFTLNQIKSLQNSPAISACQRVRSRTGLANMTRQRSVTMSPASNVLCSSAPFRGSINNSMNNTQSMPSPSPPLVSLSSTHLQIQDGGRILNVSRDSQTQMPVPEPRLAPIPVSRGGRKWDFPKRRGGGVGGGSGPTGRPTMTVSGSAAEQQAEEVVNENFPQLVIQNAREKILSDKFLQEKLAENINKILASDPTPQTSKASCGTVDPDPSIDEILGLQGEIHMSDDAIHDILEQTESDPAFQALFDLFDYNKGKVLDTDTEDMSTSLEENNTTRTPSDTSPLQTEVNPGGVSSVSDAIAISVEKTAQEPMTRKTRKSIVPCSTKKTVLVHRGRTSRLEKNTARLLQPEVSSIVAVNSKRAEKKAALPVSEVAGPMDVDESFTVPAPSSDDTFSQDVSEPARKDSSTLTPSLPNAPTVTNSTSSSIGSVAVETTSSSNVNLIQKDKAPSSSENTNSQDVNKAQAPSISSTVPCPLLSMAPPLAQESNKNILPSITLPRPIASVIAPIPSVIGSVSPTLTPSTPISTPAVPALPSPQINNLIDPHKREADPNNIVSLKIIISDEQTETPPSTSNILNQAISSISSDKIPTIFLSSPANSPAKFPVGPPGTPQTNQDEIMQAVNSLQSSEVFQPAVTEATPLSGLAQLVAPSQAQPSYIIQLPVDAANPALPGASYFIVTDPVATQDPQTRPLLLPAGVSQGQPLPANQYTVATPPHAQGYPSGSTFFLQSPVRPMVVPLSMIGQNHVGKLPLVSNQFVAIPNPVPKQQPEPAKPKAPTHKAALKPPTVSSKFHLTIANVAKGQPTEKPEMSNAPAGSSPSHKRILRFDSARVPLAPPPPPQSSPPPTSNTSTSCPAEQPGKVNPKLVQRPKPAILGGDRAKRRIATIRCTTEGQAKFAISEEMENNLYSETPPQQQRDNVKKTSRKQDHKVQVTTTACDQTNTVDISEPDPVNETESERLKSKEKKQSSSTKGNPARPNDSHDVQGSMSSASNSSAKTSSRKDSNGGTRKDPADKGPGKSREGQPEKKNAQETSNVRANKENEKAGGDGTEHQPEMERRVAPVILPAATFQPKSSKTSTLSKQAAEMLQDIQGLNPPTTPAKRTCSSTADTLSPGAGRSREEPTEGLRTPARQRLLRDGEGTPRRLIAPSTPDLPTCSPASEAGSESSINMAAHTLMILSRTAIARTGSPLKDSLRQEEAGEMSPSTAKQAKKRKRTAPPSSAPAKNEPKCSSSSKKKEKKQKKAVDTFPDDLDVDKFLSLLHYDE
ncbi:unnamed protein product [Lota lota]